MSLHDFFSKKKRDEAAARLAYDKCRRNRELNLISFRKNAIMEIGFINPNAVFLLNRFLPDFMVLLKAEGQLLIGQFADNFSPKLPVVVGDDQLRAVASAYEEDVRNTQGVICRTRHDDFLRLASENCLDSTSCATFQSRGFIITGRVDVESLYGGTLLLNGSQIATSTRWNQQPRGHFSERLYQHVVLRNDDRSSDGFLSSNAKHGGRTADISSLIFTACAYSPDGDAGGYGRYELLFDDSEKFDQTNKSSEFAKAIMNLRDFLNEIEIYFNDPRKADFEKSVRWEDIELEERTARSERGEVPYLF